MKDINNQFMSYISYEDYISKRIACNHPRVKRIWEYGGSSMTPTDGSMFRCVCVILDNDERHDFKQEGMGEEVIKDVEDFLNNLA